MANMIVDQEEQWLVNCLNATLDTNQQIRSFAEASLQQASLQQGFGTALAKVAANKEYQVGLRQLAAVLLKQFIRKHWSEDDDNFEQPIVASEEKDVIRRLILLSVDDPNSKICTAVSMAVASIALCDWPEDWADLLPFLTKLINDRTNMNGVHGALRCLDLLSADIHDKAVPSVASNLFPSMLAIVSSPQIYDKALRAKALSIVYNCTSMLGSMSGVYKAETSHLMSPMLQHWMMQFSAILSNPVESEDPDDWSLRMEVLKCLNQFVQHFSGATAKEFIVIVGPLWQTFVTSLRIYEQAMIEGALVTLEGTYDSDGEEKSFESFAIQLLEFLITIVGSARFTKVVANNLQELVYYTFGFLQITEQQMHSWSLDANQYISDEDENMYNCRVSGVLLLEEIISSFGEEGIAAIIDAVRRRFLESQQQKAVGSKFWWRIREAIIYAMASLSDEVQEAEVSGADGFDLKRFLEQLITEDIGTGVHEYPLLYARVFSSVPKFSSMISSEAVERFLNAAIAALSTDVPPPVKVGACQMLSQILPEVNKEVIQPHIVQLFSSLIDLLNHASGESLHLVLETLQAAVTAGREASSTVEPIISPVVLNMWASHVADPFITIDAIEVLEAIKSAPGCIQPLVSRVLPFIGPILSQPNQQPEGLVAGSLDLVTMLLKSAPLEVIKALYSVCFTPVIQIVLQSDDHSEMQNATECLAAFVRGGKDELLAWGGDPGLTMRSLLDSLSRLLDPNLESSGSFFVGNYILQLILNLPTQMGQHIQDLVSALVRRMHSCQIAGLKNSLLLVLARLVHMSVPNVGQFIDLLVSIPAEGNTNSFAYLTSEWVKLQGEIHGSYQIKVTTTALALLLSTRHFALANNYVQGHLIQTGAGITTRSKAKSAPEQWTMIPLNSKIFSLLADALNEIHEQVQGQDEEDSDWEEVDAEDAGINQDFVQVVTAKSSAKPAYENLAAMAKVFEDGDDDDDDDLLSKIDPLNEINLATYLVDFLTNFYQSDGPLFDQLCQSLTQSQRHAIQMVLNH